LGINDNTEKLEKSIQNATIINKKLINEKSFGFLRQKNTNIKALELSN